MSLKQESLKNLPELSEQEVIIYITGSANNGKSKSVEHTAFYNINIVNMQHDNDAV